MQPESHPLVEFYLLGCVLVIVLTIFKFAFFWLINWTIRANVLQKNIQKLLPPVETTLGDRLLKTVGIVLLEALLSWINVIVIVWQVFTTALGILRDQLQPAPEAIKVLRFPLRNNPDMTRESVWAYSHALGVRAGHELPTPEYLSRSLNQVAEHYSAFDRVAALKQFESLNAVNPEIVRDTLNIVEKSATEI